MKTFSTILSYTLVFLTIGGRVQGQYYPDNDGLDERLMRRALFELEAREELHDLIDELQVRGLFGKSSSSSSSKGKSAAAVEAPKAVPKTSAQPKIQTPAKAAVAAPAHPAEAHHEVHHEDTGLSTAPKPKQNNFATPGRTLGGGSGPSAASRSPEQGISKSGLAAMKRLEASKGKAPEEGAHTPAHPETNSRVHAMSKTEHDALSQKLDQKKSDDLHAKAAEGHANGLKIDETHKDKGAFGRFKDYASKVRHPSTVAEPEKKTRVDSSGNLQVAPKPGKKVNEAAFKSDGITVSGHKEGKWYEKAGNAIAHPLHYINDRKVDAQKKKLAFDQQFESQDKIDFQTAQNDFHKGEADRRKDHRAKQQGDVTSVNAHMRYVTAANQVAQLGKTAGVIGRRDLRFNGLNALSGLGGLGEKEIRVQMLRRRALIRRWIEEMGFDEE